MRILFWRQGNFWRSSSRSWRISQVRRKGNMAAHLLAKFVVSHRSQCVWFNVCPSVLVNVVNADRV